MTPPIRRWISCLAAIGAMSFASPAMAASSSDDPMARYEEPLCPGVAGLRTRVASAVLTRIRANADAAGIPVAEDTACQANMLIIILDDGQAYLERLADERRSLFVALNTAEKRNLLSQQGPARNWLQRQMLTLDGHFVGYRENLVEIPQARAWSAHSRIYVPVKNVVTSSMVLIDNAAIEGMTVGQIADYATLRGLVGNLPRNEVEDQATILTLFDEGTADKPEELTAFDRSLLASLYSGLPNLPANLVLRQARQGADRRE